MLNTYAWKSVILALVWVWVWMCGMSSWEFHKMAERNLDRLSEEK
jgi:hypothetical protein